MYQIERRTLDRFVISGAKVMYYSKGEATSVVKLVDISKSCIRFEQNGNVEKGDELEIELIIPSKDKIILKGCVVRVSNDNSEIQEFVTIHFATVQFSPFGTDERYNSKDSYKKLNELIEECQESIEIN